MVLQHYTSREGLEGIAKSKSLWATDFLDMTDRTELLYGYVELSKKALASAWTDVMEYLPAELRRPLDVDAESKKIFDAYRATFEGPQGSERLYVTSFARPANEEHKRLGIYTLWERFTACKGYCLEFDESELNGLLDVERTFVNYAFLMPASVRYGLRDTDRDYLDLHLQLKQNFLSQIEKARSDIGVRIDPETLWPLPTFATRMLIYCSQHKAPFFEDEREVRIMAVPGKRAVQRFLTGIASAKPIKSAPSGKHYIDLGEGIRPGIEPRRIIIGPKASPDIGDVLALFKRPPELVHAEFPI